MNGLAIIPECYVDTCLVETITGCYNQFNHQKGCGNVSRLMQGKLNDSFALGIIDKDKQEVPYIKEFYLLSSRESLFLYKHKIRHHYMIQIQPAVESFILKAVNEVGVSLTAYELPTDLKGLIKVTKQVSGNNEVDFKRLKCLFNDLSNVSEIRRLAELIQYMKEYTYKAKVEELEKTLNS